MHPSTTEGYGRARRADAVLLPLEVPMAAAYSMDLRERVFKAWKASGDADDIAATFGLSRA
jgi:hypothetical protein